MFKRRLFAMGLCWAAGAAVGDVVAGASDARSGDGPGRVASSVGDVLFYDDAAEYDAGPGAGQLLEDLEGAENDCRVYGAGFPGPLTSAGAGPYPPGEILPGITFDTTGPYPTNLINIPGGFQGNPSCVVLAGYFTDRETIRQDAGRAMGGMLQSHFSAGDCQVDVFDLGENLIATTIAPCTNEGSFFGIERPGGDIGGINIFALNNQAEGADDIRFGVPEPGMIVLLMGGALLLGRRR